jgi:hypothetical protein
MLTTHYQVDLMTGTPDQAYLIVCVLMALGVSGVPVSEWVAL